jgi:hypothetical protein
LASPVKLSINLNELFQTEIVDFDSSCLLLVENIDEYSDYYKLLEILEKHNIDRTSVNISISFTTQYDIAGFTLPYNISELHILLGCSIDFSIICLGADT